MSDRANEVGWAWSPEKSGKSRDGVDNPIRQVGGPTLGLDLPVTDGGIEDD
jgi:hypothetical protein